MEVNVGVRPLKHTVLVPVGFSDTKQIAGGLQGWQVGIFIGRVGDHEHQVDDRLGYQAQHRRRAGMLNPQGPTPKCSPDSVSLMLKELRPLRIVVDNPNPDLSLIRHLR